MCLIYVCVCIYIRLNFFKFTVFHFKWNEEIKKLRKNGKEEGRKEKREGRKLGGRKIGKILVL